MQMKRIVELLKQAWPGMLIVVLVFVIFIFPTAIPWTFIYVEVGRFVGPYLGLVLSVLILVGIIICISLVSCLMLMKLGKNNTKWMAALGLVMSFLILFSFSLVFMQRVSEAGEKIDTFIAENANLNLHDYVINVSSFLDRNVGKAYNKPEAWFRIDNYIYCTSLGPYVMKTWGVTRADLIVYQGWGTCGQAAILIEELLHGAGYEARQAGFKNIDHQWAEVKYNGTWLIVDPWYIGNFVEIQNLKNAKPAFQQASGVWVLYNNGTTVDSSPEHGY
jgi:hypothetical protein